MLSELLLIIFNIRETNGILVFRYWSTFLPSPSFDSTMFLNCFSLFKPVFHDNYLYYVAKLLFINSYFYHPSIYFMINNVSFL